MTGRVMVYFRAHGHKLLNNNCWSPLLLWMYDMQVDGVSSLRIWGKIRSLSRRETSFSRTKGVAMAVMVRRDIHGLQKTLVWWIHNLRTCEKPFLFYYWLSRSSSLGDGLTVFLYRWISCCSNTSISVVGEITVIVRLPLRSTWVDADVCILPNKVPFFGASEFRAKPTVWTSEDSDSRGDTIRLLREYRNQWAIFLSNHQRAMRSTRES